MGGQSPYRTILISSIGAGLTKQKNDSPAGHEAAKSVPEVVYLQPRKAERRLRPACPTTPPNGRFRGRLFVSHETPGWTNRGAFMIASILRLIGPVLGVEGLGAMVKIKAVVGSIGLGKCPA